MRPNRLFLYPLLFALADIGCSQGRQLDSSLQLLALDGRKFDWRRETAGSVAVAMFTRTDCPISNRYAPEVRELYERFHPQGVDFYLIYVDPREMPDDIRQHVRDYKYPCRPLRDPQHALVALTSATVTPEAVVFDPQHMITYRGRINDRYADFGISRSAATTNDLADALEATLQGRPVLQPFTKAIGCYIADLQ